MGITGYQQIASINIHHSYFGDGLCRGIVFEPDKPTNLLLKELGFLFRPSKNGFGLYADAARLSKDIQAIEKNKTVWNRLHFETAFQYPHFFHFTDLPNTSGENVLYDSQTLTSLPNNRIARLSVIFSPENDQPSKGVLVIELSELLQYRSEKGNAIFDFHFTAKSTQWNYVILNKELLGNSHLKIGNETFTFQGPDRIVLPTGENALLFSSGAKQLPFEEEPKTFFSLVDDGSGHAKPKTILNRLPIADPAQMSQPFVGDGIDAEASFIYLNL